jgi:hypothetical protein
VADDRVGTAKERYRALLVQSSDDRSAPVDVSDLPRADAFRTRMRSHFQAQPELKILEVRIGSEVIGYVTHEKIFEPAMTAGAGSGDSQGATLPGESTGYRVVWFTCRKHQPTIWIPMAYYDPRYPPSCPEKQDHKVEYAP